jgi:hypothetical protein
MDTDYLIFKPNFAFESLYELQLTKTIEKTIEKYVFLTLKPKISQRSDTFLRRILTFFDPINVKITVYPR